MKKGLVLVLGVAFLASMGFTSCKKDYTCTCEVMGYKVSETMKDAKKKDAKTWCDNANSSASAVGGKCSLD